MKVMNIIERFVDYIRISWKSKIFAIVLIALGMWSARYFDGDATFFVLTLFIGIPSFFAKVDIFEDLNDEEES